MRGHPHNHYDPAHPEMHQHEMMEHQREEMEHRHQMERDQHEMENQREGMDHQRERMDHQREELRHEMERRQEKERHEMERDHHEMEHSVDEYLHEHNDGTYHMHKGGEDPHEHQPQTKKKNKQKDLEPQILIVQEVDTLNSDGELEVEVDIVEEIYVEPPQPVDCENEFMELCPTRCPKKKFYCLKQSYNHMSDECQVEFRVQYYGEVKKTEPVRDELYEMVDEAFGGVQDYFSKSKSKSTTEVSGDYHHDRNDHHHDRNDHHHDHHGYLIENSNEKSHFHRHHHYKINKKTLCYIGLGAIVLLFFLVFLIRRVQYNRRARKQLEMIREQGYVNDPTSKVTVILGEPIDLNKEALGKPIIVGEVLTLH